MSVTNGGTAPNPCSNGGSWSLDAGSGGMVAVFSMWNLPSSRHQVHIEPSRFVVSTTTPRKPYSRAGSWAGRTSRADRKSTRLNSSHANISYAVFCLKKKKKLKYLRFLQKKRKTT